MVLNKEMKDNRGCDYSLEIRLITGFDRTLQLSDLSEDVLKWRSARLLWDHITNPSALELSVGLQTEADPCSLH